MASRILVVDDEIDIQNILVEFISVKFEVIIDSVNSGKEALDKIKKKKYNLLITDIALAALDGISLGMATWSLWEAWALNLALKL